MKVALSLNFLKGYIDKLIIVYVMFSSTFNAIIIISLSIGSIKMDNYIFINPLIYIFKPYMKAGMASSFASLGNKTTLFLNAMIHS